MKQPISSKSTPDPHKRAAHRARSQGGLPPHPRSAEPISLARAIEQEPNQPFVKGAQDAINQDLRHGMISEAAYRRYADRGYADGGDIEDWLQAEAEVDHLLLNPWAQSGPQSAA